MCVPGEGETPVVGGSPALWFGRAWFMILDVIDEGGELMVTVQTTATIMGRAACRNVGDAQRIDVADHS